ncbi:UNVERIFIED_CONTAM: hypothetical protein GTU68_061859 [Idotea baltica]|nr:hypothetical protein [Idotea baltica]
MRVVVTGGAGYIGSHTVVTLLQAGYEVVIVDSFVNAAKDVPDRIASITGKMPQVAHVAMERHRPEAVIHFAGLKAVGEAVSMPLQYYRTNLTGSLCLLAAMEAVGCHRIVFSSSATVYGDPDQVPIPEKHPLRPTNPYGHSKLMIEQVIEDWGRANKQLAGVNLRYFNPVGAHKSARIGETPKGAPNNLMPFVAQVATGQRTELSVFGNDYDTPDGTGVRDYIHVLDLADAHLAALDLTGRETGVCAINLGTGRGYSVFEMIQAFEIASGRKVPYRIRARRPGDIATCIADPTLAKELLNWQATRDLTQMCTDAWRWQRETN